MAQPTVPVYIRLEPELAKELEEQANREGVPKTEIHRKALEAYLAKSK